MVETKLILDKKSMKHFSNDPIEYMNEIIVTIIDLDDPWDEHQEKVYEQILDYDQKIDIKDKLYKVH